MCKLMLGARLVWYISQIHAGLLHLGIATTVFGDLKSRPPLSPSICMSLVSFFFANPWPFFPAVELESILTNHVDMTRKTRQTPLLMMARREPLSFIFSLCAMTKTTTMASRHVLDKHTNHNNCATRSLSFSGLINGRESERSMEGASCFNFFVYQVLHFLFVFFLLFFHYCCVFPCP